MTTSYIVPLRRMAIGFLSTLAIAGTMGAGAQVFGGHNAKAPVDYKAQHIDLLDKQNRVALSGNVEVTQAGLTVRSARMLVNYSNAKSLEIEQITALGGVEVTRGDERATGDVAVYDFGRRIITMAGNVALRRGGDNLHGGRLVIDLASGTSSVDGGSPVGAASSSGKGRVSGSFNVKQN